MDFLAGGPTTMSANTGKMGGIIAILAGGATLRGAIIDILADTNDKGWAIRPRGYAITKAKKGQGEGAIFGAKLSTPPGGSRRSMHVCSQNIKRGNLRSHRG